MRLFLCFFLISLNAHADWKDDVIRKRWTSQDPSALNLAQTLTHFTWDGVVSETMDQQIDHDCGCLGTFKQRYYVNSQFASGPDAPVFLWTCGEWTCSPNEITRGAIVTHAREAKAHIVALEHRYYGKSQVFPDLSTEHLVFLTTHQALKDLVAFKAMLQAQRSLTGPWVAFGASYPANLVAYARNQYPSDFRGSLASSGPVFAKDNFEEYDRHVADVAGPACLSRMQQVVKQLEAALSNPAELKHIKNLFQASKVEDNVDFLYLVADVAAFAVQYGYKDTFCTGLAGSKPLEEWAAFAQQVYQLYGGTAEKLTVQGALNEDPAAYLNGVGMRQWFYQSCLEYGFFQNAYSNAALSSRSSLINPDYHRKACERLFKKSMTPAVEKTNQTYYQPLLLPEQTSNIYYTNGEQDPWSLLSITRANGNDTNPNTVAYTIEGAAHCDDMAPPNSGDSQSLKTARTQFSTLVKEWLK